MGPAEGPAGRGNREGPGEVALVTGGAVRLGRAICVALAEAGCRVLLHYHRSGSEAEALRRQLCDSGATVHTIRADLSRPEEIEALFREAERVAGRLDHLVNNAAVFERVPFRSLSLEQLRRSIRLNAEAPFLCCQHAARLMGAAGGSILNIADVLAERPVRGYAHYCMSKASLLALTRCLALELAPQIRVNAVSPGAILFPEDYPPERREALLRRVPMRRAGTVEELAQAALFLLRGPAYVTGQVLAVDGGRLARL